MANGFVETGYGFKVSIEDGYLRLEYDTVLINDRTERELCEKYFAKMTGKPIKNLTVCKLSDGFTYVAQMPLKETVYFKGTEEEQRISDEETRLAFEAAIEHRKNQSERTWRRFRVGRAPRWARRQRKTCGLMREIDQHVRCELDPNFRMLDIQECVDLIGDKP